MNRHIAQWTLRSKLRASLLLIGLAPITILCVLELFGFGSTTILAIATLLTIGVMVATRTLAIRLAEPIDNGLAAMLKASRAMDMQSKAVMESMIQTAEKTRVVAKIIETRKSARRLLRS